MLKKIFFRSLLSIQRWATLCSAVSTWHSPQQQLCGEGLLHWVLVHSLEMKEKGETWIIRFYLVNCSLVVFEVLGRLIIKICSYYLYVSKATIQLCRNWEGKDADPSNSLATFTESLELTLLSSRLLVLVNRTSPGPIEEFHSNCKILSFSFYFF